MLRPAGWWMAAALTLATTGARADDGPLRPRNVVTLQPLSLVTGYWDLEYERAFGRHVSVYAAPGATFYTGRDIQGGSRFGVFAWSVDVGARWFPLRDAPSGLFVDVGGGVFTSSFAFNERVRGFGARGMLVAGYTLLLWRHLALSGGLGVQVRWFEAERWSGGDTDIAPVLRLALGGAF